MSPQEPPDDPANPEGEPSESMDLPPLGGGGGQEEGAMPDGEPEPQNDPWFGLRNSEPPVTPAEVGAELDIDAEWHEHLTCGFIKQTGSDGTEAWMHYAMALLLLLQQPEEGGEGSPDGHEDTHHADAGEPDDRMGDDSGMKPEEFL